MAAKVDLGAVRAVHLVGIGGAGMSALAGYFLQQGRCVSGSDAGGGAAARSLSKQGARVYSAHAASQVGPADLVIVSAAVAPDNAEVREARRRGIPVLTHAEALGLVVATGHGIAVAGTHGKSTTTALVGFLLEREGRDPTILAGAEMLNYGAGVRLGRGVDIVVEADEYARRFHELSPEVAVVTSIEPDHLDYYHDLAEIEESFGAFVAKLPPHGWLIGCDDDPRVRRLASPARRVGYGLRSREGWHAVDCAPAAEPPGTRFVAVAPDGERAPVALPLVGRHNVANALAALAVTAAEGVPLVHAAASLAGFRGTLRRFQLVGEAGGVRVVDDYAHHPTAVRVTLQAARARHAGPLWVVFQPHTRNRTASLLEEFAAALAVADGVVVTAVYEPLGRERKALAVSGADLAARVVGPPAVYIGELASAATYLAGELTSGALVVTMGAGDVDRLGPLLLDRLATERP